MRGDRPLTAENVEYLITKDGLGEVASGVVSTTASTEIKATLGEPGFLRCRVNHSPPATQPIIAVAGAAFEPQRIVPSMPPPDDFDGYWRDQMQLLANSHATPKLTPLDSPDETIEVFDVQIDCPGGAPVSGYLARPRNGGAQSSGAILYPHSAGVRSSDLPHAVKGAKLGLIAFNFNAHGIPNGKDDKFYAALANGMLKGYPALNSKDRERVYFRGMILRLMRALDFLTQQTQWNQRHLIVEGSSQGGGQALIAAGLNERVTLCIAAVPAMCDHTGFAINRAVGWPRIVPKDASGNYDEKVAEVARYVDAMNFARHIKCETYVTVGYIDNVCPPSSVYAAYNNIPATAKKTIISRPDMGHSFPADLIAHFDDVIRQHVSGAPRAGN